MISISKPYIGEEEKQAVLDVLSSGMIVQGPRTALFEEKFAGIAQTKFDASRVIVIVDGNTVQYKTRNGRDYVINDDDLDEIFLKMRDLYGRDCIFDGELYQLEPATLKPKSRQVSNGVATKLVRGTASLSEQQSVGITIWDIVELQPFLADSCQVEYHDRYDTLLKLIIQNPNQRVQIATNFIVDNPEQAVPPCL